MWTIKNVKEALVVWEVLKRKETACESYFLFLESCVRLFVRGRAESFCFPPLSLSLSLSLLQLLSHLAADRGDHHTHSRKGDAAYF